MTSGVANRRGKTPLLRRVVGGMLGGAVAGGFGGYEFLPWVLNTRQLHDLATILGVAVADGGERWFAAKVTAAVCAVLGVLGALTLREREEKGARALGEMPHLADFLRGAYEPDPKLPASDTLMADRVEDLFPSARMLRVQNARPTTIEGVPLTTGDVSFETGTSGRSGSRSRTVSQTVALYDSGLFRFPGFTLQPEGGLVNLLARVVGTEDIDFASHPGFSSAYHLSAVHAERTRALFTLGVLDWLSSRPGWHITSQGGSIVLYRPDQLRESDEIESFAAEAAEIFHLFELAAPGAMPDPDASPTDVRALADKMPGLMGRIARKNLVTRADVDQFVAQPVPRKIPAPILLYRDKVAPGLALVIGPGFMVGGTFFAYMFTNSPVSVNGTMVTNSPAVFVLPAIFLLVGGAITWFFGKKHIRVTRLLRRGRPGAARISDIYKTSSKSGDESWFAMRVEFQAEGRPVSASFKLTRDALVRAKLLFAAREPARILYDPADPSRILYADALITVSPEYDQ